MKSNPTALTTTVDTFKCPTYSSPWRRASCPFMPTRDGKTNLKCFLMEQRPLLSTKYPFLTPQQIKRKGRELWSKLSAKDKKTAAASTRLRTPTQSTVCRDEPPRHFPFRFTSDESLSMFSSPVRSSRKSLPSFSSASVGHQVAIEKLQSFGETTRAIYNIDDTLQVRRPLKDRTYADGYRWPCKAPPIVDHTPCQQSGILRRSDKAKNAADRRVSFAMHDSHNIYGFHDDDLQTGARNVESPRRNKRRHSTAFDGIAVNGRMGLDENLKCPTRMLNGNDGDSAKKNKNQAAWSIRNAAFEIENGQHSSSDSEDGRDFQLASLHGNGEPELSSGGNDVNRVKLKHRGRSCNDRLISGAREGSGKRRSKNKTKKESCKNDHIENGVDEQCSKGVYLGAGDQKMAQRKIGCRPVTMNYLQASSRDDKKDGTLKRADNLNVYDIFDDDNMIDLSQVRFSDYREKARNIAQPSRRRTIGCVENEREAFIRGNDRVTCGQLDTKVDSQVVFQNGKSHKHQRGNAANQKRDKKGGRNVSAKHNSSPSRICDNLRSLSIVNEAERRSTRQKDELQSRTTRNHDRGNIKDTQVPVVSSGVIAQNQAQLMTPETSDEVIEENLTSIIRAPRKRGVMDSESCDNVNVKTRVKENLLIGKTLPCRAVSRVDRVRKRLVASADAGEERLEKMKQKSDARNSEVVQNVENDVRGMKTAVLPSRLARPCTRSSMRTSLKSLSLYDTDSNSRMSLPSAATKRHAEEHDGISSRTTASHKQITQVLDQTYVIEGSLKDKDEFEVTQRLKAGNDFDLENIPAATGRLVVGREKRPTSPLLENQNVANQVPLVLSSPASSEKQSDDSSDVTSPFPCVSPLPPAEVTTGSGSSFWKFVALSQRAKQLESDLDIDVSSSDDEITAEWGTVKNTVLTRAVRSMQQITAPSGVGFSPRKASVASPTVSDASELSQSSGLSESTSPLPAALGKTSLGPTCDVISSRNHLLPKLGATSPEKKKRGKINKENLRKADPCVKYPRVDSPRIEQSRVQPPRIKQSPPRIKPPKVQSPRVKPPRLQSPRINPSRLQSPRINPPRVQSPRMNPPRVQSPRLNPPRVQSPRVQPTTRDSLCGLFDDVKPGNKQLRRKRIVTSLAAGSSRTFNELLSQENEYDIFM